ncbi:SAVED domain-containing protein [Aeromonas hydrophila]
MNSTSNHYWPILIESVEVTARDIIAQCKFDNVPACIFPIGPMPALIALGAILGNKKLFIPVLRERETSQWTITKENKDPEFFKISGLDELSSDENDVIISFNFTASPNHFTLEGKRLKFKEITITANEVGNSCMKDISQFNYFMDKMRELLHYLKSSCNTNTVHIFPCMSNMASITLGMCIDAYHPNIKIYDFYVDKNGGDEGMKSRIDINVNGTSVCLSSSN